MKLYLMMCCLLAVGSAFAQSSVPELGNYSPEEITLTECPFDKEAGAMILFDAAESNYNDQYNLVTRHRVRIKIFQQRELDRANVRIRFYSKDKFEYIGNIKGFTVSKSGDVTKLDNRSVFTEKVNGLYSEMRFAMPNVQPGSIIEYEYVSYMKHYGGLDTWEFQHDIPIRKSCYDLTVVPTAAFTYSVQKKSNYPITITPDASNGKIYFEMNDIPGLRYEPYMDAVNDYLQKVNFQLSGFSGPFGAQKYGQTWQGMANDLLSERSFGGVIRKNLPKTDELKFAVSKETSDSGKIALIYNYVRNGFSWNGYYGKYAESLKDVWEKHVGSVGELNLLLINLLRECDIEAFPMLVAERDYGRVDTTYPFLDRFNKVVAFATGGNKQFILDATEKFTPPNMVPYPILNTHAFIVDRKNPQLVRIRTGGAYLNLINVTASLSADGALKGTANISSMLYAKQIRTEKLKRDAKKFEKEMSSDNNLYIDKATYENVEDDNKPFIQNLEFHSDASENAGYAIINCNFFTNLVKNPFVANERFTNVNFGYRQDLSVKANIKMPQGFKVEKLPANNVLALGNGDIVIGRNFSIEGDTIFATITFRQSLTLVYNNDYPRLRDMYKQAIEFLNDPIVVKVK